MREIHISRMPLYKEISMEKYEFSNIDNVLEYLLQDEMGESSQIQELINALSFQ